MSIEIYADGATLENIDELNKNPAIKGFTTNPSLMRRSGVTNYKEFAMEMLGRTNKPISFEVIADDMEGMEREARIISGWGNNVFVKIPPMNTGQRSTSLITRKLAESGIKLNLTCLFTYKQIELAITSLIPTTNAIISIFAGRIMDTGISASPYVYYAKNNATNNMKILWASTREIYNIQQAKSCGADIITISPKLLQKLDLHGRNLYGYSLATIKMFRDDAVASGYKI